MRHMMKFPVFVVLAWLMLVVVTSKGNALKFTLEPYYLPKNSPLDANKFETKAIEMLAWIVANSKYKMAKLPPVIFVDRSDMDYLYTFPNEPYDAGVIGAYMYDAGVMMLAKDFTWGQDDFILLHELVHHLQSITEVEWNCKGEAEKEAYTLQALWVVEHGIGQIPDPFTMLMLGTCEMK